MFAIQLGLIIANAISCIPAVPAVFLPVGGDSYYKYAERFFDKMPSAQDLPLLLLMMKFQFTALLAVYCLGIFAGIWCATPLIGYMFAIGNLVRVIFFGYYIYGDAEKIAMSGMNVKQLNIILIVQTVMGIVIAVCTYISSQDDEYQTWLSSAQADAVGKWDEYGFYMKFLLIMHGFFTLTSLPGVIAPKMAIAQYIPVESKLPTEKSSWIVLEFVMQFQQVVILMLNVFGGVMLWYSPVIDPVALFWIVFGGVYFTVIIFSFNILNADAYGFDRLPMIIFMVLNSIVAGVSLQAYFE